MLNPLEKLVAHMNQEIAQQETPTNLTLKIIKIRFIKKLLLIAVFYFSTDLDK